MKNANFEDIKKFIDQAKKIVVIQADNPDGDSLASALALEQILEDAGKEVFLYCGVDIPSYLSYFPGSDRVTSDFPNQFDASIIVDTSSTTLLEQLELKGQKSWVASKPCLMIDHHKTLPSIDYADLCYMKPAVSTTELIYEISKSLGWKLSKESMELIAMGILSDSLGLTTEDTTAKSIHIIADLVESGVSLAELESARRETMRKEVELVHYKGKLLQRVEYFADDRIASITIPWEEIEEFSPLYNPPMLVVDDMRMTKGTDIAVCFKIYKDGKITGKIRCNYAKGIADKLAEHFGGGGHAYAAGFKIQDGRKIEDIKTDCVKTATHLLDELEAASA